jgi:uncharacterized protein (TIGR02217 family)
MAFHQVRFPLDVALGARGGPERMTDIVTLSSGREERNQRWAQSRRRYNAGYGIKSRADMQIVLAFFEERRGRFHSFLWRDGLDNSSNGPQPLGTGNGSATQFQLVKRYGAAFDPYDRPITKPVAATVDVFADGVATGGFAVDALTGIVTFGVALSHPYRKRCDDAGDLLEDHADGRGGARLHRPRPDPQLCRY